MPATLQATPTTGLQLIYRQTRCTPLALAERDDVCFVLLTTPWQALPRLPLLGRHFGWAGALKVVAKLAAGRRSLYLVLRAGLIVSTGWCNVGLCRYYPVEPDAVVVGPIWSAPASRGQGFAAFALARALNALIGQGRRVFYIDTFESNLACQRVIAKCAFGEPVAMYPR